MDHQHSILKLDCEFNLPALSILFSIQCSLSGQGWNSQIANGYLRMPLVDVEGGRGHSNFISDHFIHVLKQKKKKKKTHS